MPEKQLRDMYGRSTVTYESQGGAVTDDEIVAAVAGKRIVVDEVVFAAGVNATIFFESGASTRISGTYRCPANDTVIHGGGDLFATTAGAALTYTTTGAGAADITVHTHLEP